MGSPSTVTVKTPVRVDIAGGTLDLYPIYNILGTSLTINFAVNTLSRVEIRRSQKKGIRITTADGDSQGFANSLAIRDKGNLAVLKHVFDYFPAMGKLHLSFGTEAPSGSGLGASSSLVVALLTAIGIYSNHHIPIKKLPLVASDIESSLIKMVTGRQDYLPAIMGGLNFIRFAPGKTQLVNIERGKKECLFLEEHGFLAYTGIAHVSARANWDLIKMLLEGERKSREAFKRLLEIAEEAGDAIIGKSPEKLGKAMKKDWKVRNALSPGVTVKGFEGFIGRKVVLHLIHGAGWGGGGGGGTFFAILKNPEDRDLFESLVEGEGYRALRFSVAGGMEVRVSGKKVRVM